MFNAWICFTCFLLVKYYCRRSSTTACYQDKLVILITISKTSNIYIYYLYYCEATFLCWWQLYMPLKPTDSCSLAILTTCLSDTESSMSQNLLKFNNKSEVILFGPPNSISSFGANLGSLLNDIKQASRNLGVIFDANLCFDNQVKNVSFNSG